MITEKIKTLPELKKIVTALKSKGKKVAFTNGCFDILHYGHTKYLQDARAKGDCLVVAVNSDSSIKKIKDPRRPITGQDDRLRVIAALGCVDFVVLFNESTPLKLIKALRPDILVKGSDWDKKNIVGGDFVKSYGGRVLTVNLVKGRSTTAIIEKIIRNFAGKKRKYPDVCRVIDANLNRSKEGLRVCEEIARFILDSRGLAAAFKKIRHGIDAVAGGSYKTCMLLDVRNSNEDVGRLNSRGELKRRSCKDIFWANMQRVEGVIAACWKNSPNSKTASPPCVLNSSGMKFMKS